MFKHNAKIIAFSFTLFGAIWAVLEIFNISTSKIWISIFNHIEYSPYVIFFIIATLFASIVAYIKNKALNSTKHTHKKISTEGNIKIITSSFFVTVLVITFFCLKFAFSLDKERKQIVTDFYTTICTSSNPISEVRNQKLSVDLSALFLDEDYITMLAILSISKSLTDKTVELNKDKLNTRIALHCDKINVEL